MAAEKTLVEDDVNTASFGNCWFAGAWARLGRNDKAYEKLRHHISNATFDSLLGANESYIESVYQIDSNLGIIAVMGEMFVQSTKDSITLVPALPDEWKNGKLISAKITSPIAQTVKVLVTRSGKELEIKFKAGETIILTEEKMYA